MAVKRLDANTSRPALYVDNNTLSVLPPPASVDPDYSMSSLRQRVAGATSEENASPENDVPIELPTMLDPATCTRKGLCPVTKIRHQENPLESHSLYFEQHGTGPEKIVFIMG